MDNELKQVFSRAIRVDKNRQISVKEVPRNNLIIEGMFLNSEDKLLGDSLFLSEEATLALSSILDEWKKQRERHGQ